MTCRMLVPPQKIESKPTAVKVPIPKLDCQGIPSSFFIFILFYFIFFGHPHLLLRGDSWGRPLTAQPVRWRCFLSPVASSRPAAQAGWASNASSALKASPTVAGA